MAELRLDAGSLQAAGITRVNVDADGVTQELTLNPFTGTFDGTLFLSPGGHTLVGRAFSGEALVGQSPPVTAQITTGEVTRVELRILDLTDDDPQVFAPLFGGLTFPTTAQALQAVTFAATVFAPSGDPLTYAWTSDCADSTFSAPSAATTTWTKPTTGSCTITVVASASGISVLRNFSIAVFPPGSGSGAADVSGLFVTHPQLNLFFGELGCQVFPGSNGSCTAPIASPTVTSFNINVFSWGGGNPGALDYSDDCGGAFGSSQRLADNVFVFWLPPVTGGLCVLTVRAINSEGISGKLKMAIVVQPGTPPTLPPPPEAIVTVDHCSLTAPGQPPDDCGVVSAGATHIANGNVFVTGGHPGSVTLTDSCVGTVPQKSPLFSQVFAIWTVPSVPVGTTCTITVHATTLEGSGVDLVGQYLVL